MLATANIAKKSPRVTLWSLWSWRETNHSFTSQWKQIMLQMCKMCTIQYHKMYILYRCLLRFVGFNIMLLLHHSS